MKGPLKLMAPLVVALALAACNGGSSSMPGSPGQSAPGTPMSSGRTHYFGPNVSEVCPEAPEGYAHCHVLLERNGQKYAGNNVAGITAQNIEQAYNLPSSTNGAGQIVAIVDAYDNPNITSDLATYRAEFGLGTANFTKYNQEGQIGNYPTGDQNWGLEEDLDVSMVSAVCPKCTIYLIEGNSNSFSDLAAAEAEAVKLGAKIVSNSYGGTCSGSCYGYGTDYETSGITYVASAGDYGYASGVEFPAELDTVAAVGGTILSQANNKRGWSEVVWPGTQSGCETSETKPTWQDDPDCTGRLGNDVAAVAQNAAEYDSYGYGGWITVNGTSIAAPLNASIFALAGNATSQLGGHTFWKPRHDKTAHLYHISSGNNGTCSPEYYCTDGLHPFKNGRQSDYGGPTGWGTPHGIGAY